MLTLYLVNHISTSGTLFGWNVNELLCTPTKKVCKWGNECDGEKYIEFEGDRELERDCEWLLLINGCKL